MKTTIQAFPTSVAVALLASAGLVACGAGPDQGPTQQTAGEQPTTTENGTSSPASDSKPASAPIASVVNGDHVIDFYEASPGIGAVVETGPLGEKPLLGNTGKSSLTEVFRSLTDAAVPDTLVRADAARAAHMDEYVAPDAVSAVAAAHGPGNQFYTTGEQTWFRNTFCNGAEVCSQGWGWATTGNVNHNSETFIAMDGSEGGSQNANFWIDYWKPQPTVLGVPIACGWGVDCGWIAWLNIVVVPGHWVSENVWGAPDFEAGINNAGNATQVSIAARH